MRPDILRYKRIDAIIADLPFLRKRLIKIASFVSLKNGREKPEKIIRP
jgi:hypothetical protein